MANRPNMGPLVGSGAYTRWLLKKCTTDAGGKPIACPVDCGHSASMNQTPAVMVGEPLDVDLRLMPTGHETASAVSSIGDQLDCCGGAVA